jgi:hypothetical protein
MPYVRLDILALGLASCSSLLATTPVVPSLHLGLATAQGDFRNEMGSKVGMDAALSLTIPMTATLAFRPMLSFQSFPTLDSQYTYNSARYSDRGNEDARWSAWSYGADLLYRPRGPEGSLYFLAGVYLKVWKLQSFGSYATQDSLNATRVYSLDDTSTKDEPAVALGLGYSFNRHLSLEARSVLASYRSLAYNTLGMALVISY